MCDEPGLWQQLFVRALFRFPLFLNQITLEFVISVIYWNDVAFLHLNAYMIILPVSMKNTLGTLSTALAWQASKQTHFILEW